jgi:3-deoxy-D-manno-octulosonate 8-phosphate phosphatase (KDO 8-P phosphatase)
MISAEKARLIKAVILDIDGVLTDGRVGYGAPDLIKFFHYRDGHWMKLALRAGIMVGLLSGRESRANRERATELGLTFVRENIPNKLDEFEKILQEYDLKPEECLYIGDDVIDMPVMSRVGIPVAVADGVPELDEVAIYRTTAPGGHGAVCETMRLLLKARGDLDGLLERYRI